MTRRILILIGVIAVVGALVPMAAAGERPSSANLETPGTSRVVTLPGAAGQHAVHLGTAFDPGSLRMVDGYAIFHHRPGHGGGPGGGGPGNGDDSDSSSCFALIAKGAAWGLAEPWVFNTDNDYGLPGNNLFTGLDGDLAKWETAAAGANIFGIGSTTNAPLSADTISPDNLNEVYFGDIASPGAIAVTIVWGVFRGPPSSRTLVEWDMVFDHADYSWSLTGAPGDMDFRNIATHEAGHAAGLAHPADSCTEETMYRFASEGETKKRDLNDGDVAGINELY